MWRLDTALNWKDWRLYWHQKLRYEVCWEPQCMEWEVRDPNTWECVPACTPQDADYECNCTCWPNQVCEWWICVDEQDPECEPPYVRDPETGDCVCEWYPICDPEPPICPEWKHWDDDLWKCVWDCNEWPCPDWYTDYYDEEDDCRKCKWPKEPCWRCYKEDPNTWECVWNSDECGSSGWTERCPECRDKITWKCVKCPKRNDIDHRESDVNPPKTYCDDYTIYWSWWYVTQEWKITWANNQSSTQSWIRYWYSTECYSKVECYFRFTSTWVFPNKSAVEFWHTRTIPSWKNYAQHIVVYDLWKADWRYNDVFKLIIYADWKQETYWKRFIREWVWTEWSLYDCTRYPECPPADEIKWMMLWVGGPAEIRWIATTLKDWDIIVTDPEAEPTAYPQQARATYDKKVYWTVIWEKWNIDVVWKTPIFLYKIQQDVDWKWKEWDTINWCTYNDWALTIPESDYGSFKYTGRWQLPDPYWWEYSQWIFDMKFRITDNTYHTWDWTMYIRTWWDNLVWAQPYLENDYSIDTERLYWKECRLQMESYCNQSWEYNSYLKIFTWNWSSWDTVLSENNPFWLQVTWWETGFLRRPYFEIVLSSYYWADWIYVHYAMEWTGSWRW